MAEPSIGVVIPAYNAGPYLLEAIESVRGQTLQDWECIIVDDGSTDETSQCLQSIRDPRVQSIRQENRGEWGARMRGFSMVRASLVVFLDADDRLFPDALARFSLFLSRHDSVGVAYGSRRLIDKRGKPFGWKRNAFLNNHPEGDVLEDILRRPFLSTPSQACFRREAIPPPDWHKGITRWGDWLLLAGAAFRSRFAYLGSSPLVEYRIHSGSQLRRLAQLHEGPVNASEFDEVLEALFSIPGLADRFSPEKLVHLRKAATASCLAIKGQEFLRHREYRAARYVLHAALRAGSRDIRDRLCWLATYLPFVLRLAEPLYGIATPK